MKEVFIVKNFRASSIEIIHKANEIIEEYVSEGYDMTLRQLYYQFVARDLIENTQKSYKRLGEIVNDGRLAGYIDWDCLRDRTRFLRGNIHWSSPKSIVSNCINRFKVDRWKYQDQYVEVWIEKDALIGVIEKVCRKNDVNYFACRGYVSQSFMYDAAKRFERQDANHRTIIHLGDHDPSGIDMTRDIQDRFNMFQWGQKTDVIRIALNMDQVDEYEPPPNPAKITDSRSPGYVKQFGGSSWELDALTPQVIVDLIQDEIDLLKDEDAWQQAVNEEIEGRVRIRRAVEAM